MANEKPRHLPAEFNEALTRLVRVPKGKADEKGREQDKIARARKGKSAP